MTGERVLCTTCASRLIVVHISDGRWTLCALCDAGWLRDRESGRTARVGPPLLLQLEGLA